MWGAVEAVGGQGGSARAIVTVSGDSGTGALKTIGGKGIGGQYGEGQGEDQFGFHGVCSRCVDVLCVGCGVHTTRINLIKKRKYLP
ncbi:hypothetical protein D3C78_1584720 [compost metagenome]